LCQRFSLLIIHIAVDRAFTNVLLWKLSFEELVFFAFSAKHQSILPRKLY